MSDYSGVLGDGVLGNLTLGDDPSSGTFAFGQAQTKIAVNTLNGFGQGQADIKQTYNSFAQSQSDIKQTYNGFSQAQGDIKQIYFGFAQSQALIGTIGRTFAQAQTDIQQTYQVYAQAQARILQIYQGYGQSQGAIVIVQYGFGQTQGDINQTYNVFAQSQADILAVGYGFGQAQSDILQTYQGYGQSQADIDQISQVYGQAQATLIILRSVFAQAKATLLTSPTKIAVAKGRIKVSGNNRSGNAQAKIIFKQSAIGFAQGYIYAIPTGMARAVIASPHKQAFAQAQGFISCYTDTFTRTTTFGLGTAYTWQSWDSSASNAAGSLVHVDGSKAVWPGWYDAYSINQTVPTTGSVQFDFHVPNSLAQNHVGNFRNPTIGVRFGDNYTSGQAQLYVGAAATGWKIGSVDSNLTIYGAGVGFTPDEDTWYTAKMRYDNAGNVSYKVWKQADPEPVDYLFSDTVNSFVSHNTAWIDLYYRNYDSTDTYLDNLTFCIPFTYTIPVYGQAQAFINTSVSSGQSQADILQTYNQSSQAQAAVNAGWGIGNVQAYIIGNPNVFAQAGSLIELRLPFIDTFDDRYTVDPDVLGMGQPYYWPGVRQFIGGLPSNKFVYVDGQQLVIPEHGPGAFNTNNGNDAYWIPIRRLPEKGFVQFDFNPGHGTRASAVPMFWIRGKSTKNDRIMDVLIQYNPANVNSPWQISSLFGNTGSNLGLANDTWYTILMTWNEAANPLYSLKIWDRNTGSEGNPLASQSGTMFSTESNALWNVTFVGASTDNFYIDNLKLGRIWPTSNAQARIKTTNVKVAQASALINARFGLAQAQATILATPAGYGQAQAQANFWLGVGQAAASIFNTFANAQAQARINITQGYAQARAQINIKWAFAQAQAQITVTWRFGQAQGFLRLGLAWAQAKAHISRRYKPLAQAQAYIKILRWVWAQAQGFISPRIGLGQTQGQIIRAGFNTYAQAQSYIGHFQCGNAQAQILTEGTTFGWAQAQTQIGSWNFGQAQAFVGSTIQCGQAQAIINNRIKPAQAAARIGYQFRRIAQAAAKIGAASNCAQAQALIVNYISRCGQAQAFILRTIRYGQAQGFIEQTQAGNLVRFNGYLLPGYLQEENHESPMGINIQGNIYGETYNEYIGLQNKMISIRMKVVQSTYSAAKEKVLLAGSLVRSSKDWAKLTIIDTTRYYLAKTKTIKLEQQAGQSERNADYTVEFECKPWKYGDYHSISGTTLLDTDSVGRNIRNGTWTPATIILTGNNITVSGYTATEPFTGFVSVSGVVSNLEIDTENYTATMSGQDRTDLMNYDYKLNIGPGRTLFAVTGATSAEIIYQDRWPL